MTRECKNEIHVKRDNDFGITWCIRCGRLFTKPSNKKITEEEIVRYNSFRGNQEKKIN